MLFALLLALCFSAAAYGQSLSESIEVSIVNVDVHVTDKQGNRVGSLRKEDFKILENGKPQPITNFFEYTSSASAGSTSIEGAPATETPKPTADATPRVHRSIILFVEPVTLANFRTKELFDSIRALLRRTVEKGDQVSIVTFMRAMRIRQPFTDDLQSIETSLAALEKEMSGPDSTSYEQSRWVLAQESSFEKEFEDALSEMGLGAKSGAAASASALAAARRERFLIRQKAAALQSLIQSMSGADGKKIVIMATRRFGLYAGAEFFGGTVPNEYKQELDTTTYRRALIETANAHGVTVYPVAPEGLAWTVDNDASVSGNEKMESTMEQDLARTSRDNNLLVNETAALQQVADATGGITAWGSTGIARILPRVSDDLENYYSLGYRASASGKDAARTIVVRTKNRDLVVRSRKQYIEKSETTQIKDRVLANLYQRVEGSTAAIPFEVAAGAIKKTGKNHWSVPLKIRIPIRSLTTLPQPAGESGSFSVFFATGGVLGVMSEVEQRTQKFEIPRADVERAKGSHFTYELTLAVDHLVQQLSVAVMDDVGKEFGLKRFTLPQRQ